MGNYFIRLIQPAVFYVPFTFYFLLFGIAVCLSANSWLGSPALITRRLTLPIFSNYSLKQVCGFLLLLLRWPLFRYLWRGSFFFAEKKEQPLFFDWNKIFSNKIKPSNPCSAGPDIGGNLCPLLDLSSWGYTWWRKIIQTNFVLCGEENKPTYHQLWCLPVEPSKIRYQQKSWSFISKTFPSFSLTVLSLSVTTVFISYFRDRKSEIETGLPWNGMEWMEWNGQTIISRWYGAICKLCNNKVSR